MTLNRTSESNRPPRRRLLPRLGIAARAYLGVLALALALLITEGAAWINTEQQARAQSEIEIEDGLDGFQSDFVRTTRELLALGDWLVNQKTFSELVQARDGAALVKYLEPWTSVNIVDSILVSDQSGNALVRLGEYSATAPLPSNDLPGMPEARVGKRVVGLAQDSAGRLQARVILPVYMSGNPSPEATLLLGIYLDGSFLQYRFRKLDQEIAIVYNDKLYIITLTNAQGISWGGNVAPPAILKAQREGRASNFVTLDTDIGSYLFKFKPLQSPGTNPGMYGVGIAVTTVDQLRTSLFQTFGVSAAPNGPAPPDPRIR